MGLSRLDTAYMTARAPRLTPVVVADGLTAVLFATSGEGNHASRVTVRHNHATSIGQTWLDDSDSDCRLDRDSWSKVDHESLELDNSRQPA